jgi:hypothetical protein
MVDALLTIILLPIACWVVWNFVGWLLAKSVVNAAERLQEHQNATQLKNGGDKIVLSSSTERCSICARYLSYCDCREGVRR